MSPPDQPLFQSHHAIEQQAFKESRLLRALSKQGLFELDGPGNLLNLPADQALAAKLRVSPHTGGPLGEYSNQLRQSLSEIEDSDAGQAALKGDKAAAQQVAAEVNHLRDTLKAGLINNDLVANTPEGMTPDQANQKVKNFFKDIDGYGERHAPQIQAIGKMQPDEAQWAAVTKSEANVTASLEAIEREGVKAAKGDALAAKSSLERAIGQARSAGRLAPPEALAAGLRGATPEPTATEPPPVLRPKPTSGTSASEVAPELRPKGFGPGGEIAVKGIGAAGVALMAYDFVTTGNKVVQLESQGNATGAESARTHFIGRNAGGIIGGFGAGFLYGAVAGSETGPGAVVTGLGGGVVGAFLGEKWAEQKDRDKVFKQTDRDGNEWSRNPDDPKAGWTRTIEMPASGGGYRDVTANAAGRLADELNYKAANASYELGLANPSKPQNPYELPAKAGDPPAFRENPWTRDAQTGVWSREVLVPPPGGQGLASVERKPATPERAAELDQQSNVVIAQNAANSPAAIAARYQIAYNQFGWNEFGPPSKAVENAAAQTQTLQASNGDTYTRNANGEWTTPGMIYGTNTATGNIRNELNAEAQSQKAGLQEMSALAAEAKANPTVSTLSMRSQVADAYARAGMTPGDAKIDAAATAVTRNQERDGIKSNFTLQVRPDQSIVTLVGHDDGRMEVRSVTTAQDIAKAQQPAMPSTPSQQTTAPTRELPTPAAPLPSDTSRYNPPPSQPQKPSPSATSEAIERPATPSAPVPPSPGLQTLMSKLDCIATGIETGDRAGIQKEIAPYMNSPEGKAFFAEAKAAAGRENTLAGPSQPRDPRNPDHPDHALNQSIREQLTSLHAKAGIYPSDARIEPLTAAVALNVRESRMTQVDQLQFNADKSSIIATQGSNALPAHSVTAVQQAMQAQPEHSYKQMAQVTQQQAQSDQNKQQQTAQPHHQQRPSMGH